MIIIYAFGEIDFGIDAFRFISENTVTDTKDNNENMYIWDNCKKTQFIEAIDNSKIKAILKKKNYADISALCETSASKTFKVKKSYVNKNSKQKRWFNDKCKQQRVTYVNGKNFYKKV